MTSSPGPTPGWVRTNQNTKIMYISEIQETLMEIIKHHPIDRVFGFVVSYGAMRDEMTDAYHIALWLEGAPVAVKEEFLQRFNEEDWPEMRICDTCGSFMKEGYLLGDMAEHYCSRECAIKSYIADAKRFTGEGISREEAESRFEKDLETNEDCFWTEWR